MEALSCGTPVIATNWSGPTAYLTNDNGYLLSINGLIDVRLVLGLFYAIISSFLVGLVICVSPLFCLFLMFTQKIIL